MKYNFNDNSLLHSVDFNLRKFEIILKHGILSDKKADELSTNNSKKYYKNASINKYITCVRVGDIENYNNYNGVDGINFIVEDVPFIMESDYTIHKEDVLVKNKISRFNITGICLDNKYKDMPLNIVPVISKEIRNYEEVILEIDNYVAFIENYNGFVNHSLIEEYKKDLVEKFAFLPSYNISDKSYFYSVVSKYYKLLTEINMYLGNLTFMVFSKILGKPASLEDAILFLNNDEYVLYDLPEVMKLRRNI